MSVLFTVANGLTTKMDRTDRTYSRFLDNDYQRLNMGFRASLVTQAMPMFDGCESAEARIS